MRELRGRAILAAALALAAIAIGPQAASADPLTKLQGAAGCVADPATSLPADSCATAKGIDDATDVAISPDGRFLYAAATSSNSIAVFARDPDAGTLTQLDGSDGCIAAGETPIDGCATGNGLVGPSSLAMSPDGKNVYVTTFVLDTEASPPEIEGTLTTFSRDEGSGVLAQTDCVVGGVPSPLAPVSPPAGCTQAAFPQNPTRAVPLGTASDVEVSPDGSTVVTSSFLPGAVINWTRAASGELTPQACYGTTRSIFPTNSGNPLSDVCAGNTGGAASGLAYPLDVEFAPDGSRLYAAALGLEQAATEVGGVQVVPAADEPGSIAVFNRGGDGSLAQPANPNGCIDDARDVVQPETTCTHRTALLNPYRVNASPDGKNVYVGTLNVFPPEGLSGPGPGELSQFNSDLTQLTPPCLQQLGLPSNGLEPTPGCDLLALGLILPSDVAFAPDGSAAYVSSLFHSVGSYPRSGAGTLMQDKTPGGCSIDPRNLPPGTEILGQVCQNAVPLNAPTSIELSADGKFAYVTSGGFLTGDPNFGPALAEAGIESDDAITIFAANPSEPSTDATCKGREATIVADGGGKLKGTKGADVIVGSKGKDKIKARGGADTVCALGGKDVVDGGGGKDLLLGGPGKDKLKGGPGKDKLVGGPGKDKLAGGPGKDSCKGKKDRKRSC